MSIDIEYIDTSPVVPVGGDPLSRGGPYWKGTVDTAANTLTITEWQELPSDGQAFWTPDLSAGPLVWDAVTSDGSSFDVPDTFGQGYDPSVAPLIGTTWGFVSRVSANNMSWVNGDFNILDGNNGSNDYFPGWGAFGRVADQGTSDPYQVGADETEMPIWPTDPLDPNLGTGFNSRPSTGATVLVAPVVDASTVPEMSPLTAGMLISLGCGVLGFLRR